MKENTVKNDASLKSDQIQQHKDFLTEKRFYFFVDNRWNIRLFFLNRNMLVSTQEFVNTIRQIQKVSNQSTDAQVWEIIHQFDHNKDGFIEADEILKVKKTSIL